MMDDMFVINPVAHAYNLLPENVQDNRSAESLRDMLPRCTKPGTHPASAFERGGAATDWPLDVLAKTLFLESDVDLAAFHTLRLDSYMKDGLCRHEKTLEAVTNYPDRFLAYVGVDPTAGLDVCLRELDEQLEDIPNPVGLKLYPSQVAPYRFWRMDDPDPRLPAVRTGQERGIKHGRDPQGGAAGPGPDGPVQDRRRRGRRRRLPRHQLRDHPLRPRLHDRDRLGAGPLPERLRQLRDHLVADRESAAACSKKSSASC